MKTKAHARHVFHPLLAAAILLAAGSVFAQERKEGGSAAGGPDKITICHIPPGQPNNPQTITINANALSAHIPGHIGDYAGACRPPVADGGCKAPITLNLAANTPSAHQPDFSTAAWSNHVKTLGYSGVNKFYLHTFNWERKCGQIKSATLTVNLKANSAGASPTSSDAGNDTMAVVHNGVSVAGTSGPLYSSHPFPAGTLVTKTFNLSAAALANMNLDNRLSFNVQDDTMVVSATLQLTIN
jgi:hypothetical protein